MDFLFKIVLLISRLPLKVLYIFSDTIYFLNQNVVGYRKNIVKKNIRNSFPQKSAQEINRITSGFFKNFTEYLAETIRSFTITPRELRVRVQHINQDIFHQSKENGKNIILLAGHVFNWEWFNALATIVPQEHTYPVYRKVNSEFWEEQVKKIRNKYGNTAIEANDVIRHIFRNKNDGNSVYMFVADQTPNHHHAEYGISFLNQKTPVFIGYDKLATRMDLTFVYCEMKKVKRGYYQINYHEILPDGEKFEEFEVVKKFHKMLENTIRKRPENYLWSHRKWKYSDRIKKMIPQ